MAGVVLKNVNKIFTNGFQAVHDLNLEIEDGEFMVLVGPSGCAKSTTLNLIAGLEALSSGEIWIGDRLVNDLPPKERDIAMVFQNYALYPHMNVYQNMAFGLKLRKLTAAQIDRRVRQTAAVLDLEPLLDRKPKALSGGQRQRVAVGRAIVREPTVFLLDEPLSNLDAKLRVHMRLELAKLHKQLATTIIYVTHDQVEAMTLGDRITVMREGVIQQVDTPLNLYRRPVNRFVGAFIGSPTMNIVPGTLLGPPEAPRLSLEDGGNLPLPREQGETARSAGVEKVLLGIRPEFFHVRRDRTNEPQTVTVDVEIVEQMGNETHVHFRLGGSPCTATVPAEAGVAETGRTTFSLDIRRCHLFDARTERNLLA